MDYLVLAIMGIAPILEATLWNPWEKPYQPSPVVGGTFAYNDNQFQFPMRDDTFPPWATVLLSFVWPIVSFFVFAILGRWASWREYAIHDLHNAILGISTAWVIGYFAWFPINKTTGSFRPDFYARLQTGDPKIIAEGREAFPSGHTTLAFLGLGFFSLWLCGKFRVFHSTRGNVWRYFLAVICPMSLACAQAVTRVTDFRHHTVDILGGAVLGLFAAVSAYHLFYPPVWAPDCYRPKNRRWAYPYHLMAGAPAIFEAQMEAPELYPAYAQPSVQYLPGNVTPTPLYVNPMYAMPPEASPAGFTYLAYS